MHAMTACLQLDSTHEAALLIAFPSLTRIDNFWCGTSWHITAVAQLHRNEGKEREMWIQFMKMLAHFVKK